MISLPVLEQVVRGRQVRYPRVVEGLMETRLMVPTVVGGHGPVVRPGGVQRGRVEVRVEHVGGRRRSGGHGRRRRRRRHLDCGRGIIDGHGRGRGSRRRCCGRSGRGRRQFPLRPARGQKVPQVRLVPAPGLRRLRLAGRPGRPGARGRAAGRQRPGQLFRVAEVAVRQARVQIAHLEVHGPLSEQIAAFFFPVRATTDAQSYYYSVNGSAKRYIRGGG